MQEDFILPVTAVGDNIIIEGHTREKILVLSNKKLSDDTVFTWTIASISESLKTDLKVGDTIKLSNYPQIRLSLPENKKAIAVCSQEYYNMKPKEVQDIIQVMDSIDVYEYFAVKPYDIIAKVNPISKETDQAG